MSEAGAVLAIEASQRDQSVALALADGSVRLETIDAADRSREDLVPAIERLARASGIGPCDLRGVVLNGGPGGFTGLRMAHAVAQAFAAARGVPVVQVDGATCARMAAVLAGDLEPSAACWVALASKGSETWIALAARDVQAVGSSIEAHAWDPGSCRVLVADAHLPQPWQARTAELGVRLIPLRSDARAVLASGLPGLERGEALPAAALVPVYPREAEAVRLWRQRHGARTG